MSDESLVCIITQVAVSLEDGLEIAALAIELPGKLFLSERLAKSKSIADYRIDSLDAVLGQFHEVQYIVIAVQAVKIVELRRRHGHAIPLATARHADLHT